MNLRTIRRKSAPTRSLLLALLSMSLAFQGGSVFAEELTEQEMKRGRILYLQCQACHSLTPKNNEGKLGPSLAGVYSRTAGSADYYENYSDALSASAIEWTTESMGQWLKGPAQMVPGTSMVFAGIENDSQRDLLVRYLKVITKAASD